MQESTGNVGINTTKDPGGEPTRGLMQAQGSPGFPGKHGLSQVSLLKLIDGEKMNGY